MTAVLRPIVVLAVLSLGCSACAKTTLTSPSEAASALDVNTFSSVVVPGGSAGREFELTAAGRIVVTLTATTPSGVVLGLGIGIPRADSSCALATAADAAAGGASQVSITAEAGRYCAKAYDPGRLSAPVPFTFSISRP